MKNAITLTDLPRLAELFYEAAQKNHALLLAPIACEVLHKTMVAPLPEPAAPVSNDTIARSKRILALVDDYHDRPTQETRTALRKALMDEFESTKRSTISPRLTNEQIANFWVTSWQGGDIPTDRTLTEQRKNFARAVERAAMASSPAAPEYKPEYSTITDHNGKVTGVHWVNADKAPIPPASTASIAKASAEALAWYDNEQAEAGITRDSFHLFVLDLLATCAQQGSSDADR